MTILTKFSEKKWKWIFVGFAENLSKKLKSGSDRMSKIPITEQCITDCSMLNQTTCLPASPKPATIINYHLVSLPTKLNFDELWAFYFFVVGLLFLLHIESESRHTWEDLKGVCHIWALFRIEKAFHIKSVDILEMIWKGFVNFLLSYLSKDIFHVKFVGFRLFQIAMMQSKHKSASYNFFPKMFGRKHIKHT